MPVLLLDTSLEILPPLALFLCSERISAMELSRVEHNKSFASGDRVSVVVIEKKQDWQPAAFLGWSDPQKCWKQSAPRLPAKEQRESQLGSLTIE